MTAWVLVAILGAALLLMIALYRRSVREVNHLITFTLFVLTDESVYQAQRDGLRQFISSTTASNAVELATKVRTSTTQLADRLADKITLGCHAAIWNLRQKPQQAAAPGNAKVTAGSVGDLSPHEAGAGR